MKRITIGFFSMASIALGFLFINSVSLVSQTTPVETENMPVAQVTSTIPEPPIVPTAPGENKEEAKKEESTEELALPAQPEVQSEVKTEEVKAEEVAAPQALTGADDVISKIAQEIGELVSKQVSEKIADMIQKVAREHLQEFVKKEVEEVMKSFEQIKASEAKADEKMPAKEEVMQETITATPEAVTITESNAQPVQIKTEETVVPEGKEEFVERVPERAVMNMQETQSTQPSEIPAL